MEIGKIYRLEVNLPNRLDKYAIAVSVSSSGFFLINSENRAMYDCIPLLKKGRAFPVKNSHIACAEMIIINPEKIVSEVGVIDREDAESIINHVSISRRLPGNEKKQIIQELSDFLEDMIEGW